MTIKLLTQDQVAEMLGVKTETMRHWRMRGTGPIFTKIGANVRYSEAHVLAFINAGARISTSQKAPAEAVA